MIVLRTPKGWTGPKEVDGLPAEGSFRSHQVPLADLAGNPEHLAQLEEWCAPTAPRSCSTRTARCARSWPRSRPQGERRMGANPHANGGLLLRELELPDFRDYAVEVPAPTASISEPTRVLGAFLRDVIRAQPRDASASWAPTRRPPTAWARCSRSPTARGRPSGCRPTTTSRPTGG